MLWMKIKPMVFRRISEEWIRIQMKKENKEK